MSDYKYYNSLVGGYIYKLENTAWHREDGPACEIIDDIHGSHSWWLNDKNYSFQEWCKKLNKSTEEITYLKLKFKDHMHENDLK